MCPYSPSVSVIGQHFSLRQLGICEPPPRRGLPFCSDIGLPHHGFSVGTAQEVDSESQAVMSPERAMRLWGRGGLGKTSGRSSCLSSRSNSVLTLTDTEHENKSDSDNGRTWDRLFRVIYISFFEASHFPLRNEYSLIDVGEISAPSVVLFTLINVNHHQRDVTVISAKATSVNAKSTVYIV